MKTLCWKITVSFSIFLISLNNYGQVNYTWSGGSGNWNEATNWSPNGIPGEVDTASINTDGDYTVTLDVDTTIAKIIIGGESGTQTLSISNRNMTVIEDIEISSNGAISITSSTITGYGSISNSGTFTSSGLILNMEFENEGLATFHGTSTISDSIITKLNSTINISSYTGGVIKFTSAKGFVNNGILQFLTYNYWGGGTIEVSSGSLINSEGGVINNLTSGTISSSSTALTLAFELKNHGVVTIDRHSVLNKQDALHDNSGEFIITNHNLTITQVGTISAMSNSGTISVDAQSNLTINGGTFDYISGLLEVEGTFLISNSVVNILPEFTNTVPLTLSGVTLNCSSSFTNQNSLSLINSTINGDDIFTNQDTLTARGTTFNQGFDNMAMATFSGVSNLTDTLIIQENSMLHITSYSNIATQFTAAKGIVNSGTMKFLTYNYWGSGFIDITNGMLVNGEQGRIEVLTSGVLSSASTPFVFRVQLENQGDIIFDRHTNLDKASAKHFNNGTITVSNHKLSFIQTGTDPAFTNTGTLTIDSTSYLSIDGGSFNYIEGTFEQNGIMTAFNTILNLTPEFINYNPLTITNSTINNLSTFTNQGSLSINNSVVNGDHFFINQDTMSVNGVEFNMDFNNMGMATFSGNVDINDTLITHPNTTLNISSHIGGAMDFTSLKGFTNMGLLQCLQYNYWGRGIVSVYNGKLINSEDGIFNVLVLGTLSSSYSPFVLDIELENHGEVYIDHSTNLNKVAGIHKNSGTFTIKNNILSVQQAGTIFNNEPTGSIFGDGTLAFTDAAFANSGAINPGLSPGLLNIITDVAQDSTSEINIELGGLTVGDLHDKLNVTGSMVLDGLLNISLINDFTPSVGDVFDIIGYSSATGNFDKVNGLYPGTGVIFSIEQNASNINILTEAYDNNSPYVENPISDIQINEDFTEFQFADLDTIFNDMDIQLGDKLSYSCLLSDNLIQASVNGSKLSLQSLPDSNGMLSLVVSAIDAGQEVARDTFEINILPQNDPPALAENVIKIPDLILLEDFTDTVIADLDSLFTDIDIADGDSLSYTYSLSNSLVNITMDKSIIILHSVLNLNGELSLIIFATDKQQTSISDTIDIEVNGMNDAPEAFSLISPTDNSILTDSESIYFEWEASADVDEDVIAYTLSISSTTWDTIISEISGTNYTLTNTSSLESNTTYEWSVNSSDGIDEKTSNEIFSFTTPVVLKVQNSMAYSAFELKQNYPNPFSSYTYIDFSLPKTENVTIKVYSLTGQLIQTEFFGKLPAGNHSFYFNAESISRGVYLYQLESGSYNEVKKMTITD